MTSLSAKLEMFKLAATLFVGLGLTTILQQRLLPKEDDEATSRAHRTWTTVETFLASAMLVLIAAGEIVCIRVLTAGSKTTQQRLADVALGPTRWLLAITAVYVVVSFLLARLLSVAWRWDEAEEKRDTANEQVAALLTWALLGAAAGAFVLAGVLRHKPTLWAWHGTPTVVGFILAGAAVCSAAVWAILRKNRGKRLRQVIKEWTHGALTRLRRPPPGSPAPQ